MDYAIDLFASRPGSLEAASYSVASSTCPFLRVTSEGVEYAQTAVQKKELLDRMKEDETIVWPWVGKWSTDVFRLSLPEAKSLLAMYYGRR